MPRSSRNARTETFGNQQGPCPQAIIPTSPARGVRFGPALIWLYFIMSSSSPVHVCRYHPVGRPFVPFLVVISTVPMDRRAAKTEINVIMSANCETRCCDKRERPWGAGAQLAICGPCPNATGDVFQVQRNV